PACLRHSPFPVRDGGWEGRSVLSPFPEREGGRGGRSRSRPALRPPAAPTALQRPRHLFAQAAEGAERRGGGLAAALTRVQRHLFLRVEERLRVLQEAHQERLLAARRGRFE